MEAVRDTQSPVHPQWLQVVCRCPTPLHDPASSLAPGPGYYKPSPRCRSSFCAGCSTIYHSCGRSSLYDKLLPPCYPWWFWFSNQSLTDQAPRPLTCPSPGHTQGPRNAPYLGFQFLLLFWHLRTSFSLFFFSFSLTVSLCMHLSKCTVLLEKKTVLVCSRNMFGLTEIHRTVRKGYPLQLANPVTPLFTLFTSQEELHSENPHGVCEKSLPPRTLLPS